VIAPGDNDDGPAAPTAGGRDTSGNPAVVFADGRAPETATRVQMESFEGPLALLLALIEARQLDVLSVPLGALAEAYLDALAGLEVGRLGNISAFVAVASQLILIKSRAILPRHDESGPRAILDEGPDPEEELRARLVLYRAFRDAGARLAEEADRRVGLFRREPTAAQAAALAGARPSHTAPLDPLVLVEAVARIVRLAPPPELPPEVVPRAITIAERAAAIRSALRGAPTVVLQELLRGIRDRVVITVTFLALLELMKRREIVVEQAEPWGPIVARRATPAEGGIVAPGEGGPADEPFDESLGSFA